MSPIKQALEALKPFAECTVRFTVGDLRRASTAYEALSKYQGWVLVPKEADDEMANAGESSLVCGPDPEDLKTSPSFSWAHAKSAYRAMLRAAAKQHMEGE